MDFLKAKVDAGADYICTQLFLTIILSWITERCLLAGIKVPILAGIMPVNQPVRHEPHGRGFPEAPVFQPGCLRR